MNLLVTLQEGGMWLPAHAYQPAMIELRLNEHLQTVQPDMHAKVMLSLGTGSAHHTWIYLASVRFPDGRFWNSVHGWSDDGERGVAWFERDMKRLSNAFALAESGQS